MQNAVKLGFWGMFRAGGLRPHLVAQSPRRPWAADAMPLFGRKKSLGERVHKLVERNEVKRLQDLLVDSATGSVAQRKAAIEHRDKQGRTPIVLAASRGSFLMTKLLVQAGADVNSLSNSAKSCGGALHECAHNGFEAVAKLLIEVGADPYLENMRGFTALDFAIMKGFPTLVRMFENRALFSGWLSLKVNRYHGISHRWKPRWVSVFSRTAHPKGNSGSQVRLQLCCYKDFQSFKPFSRAWLDGARAEVGFQAGPTPDEEVLQCTLCLPPGRTAAAAVSGLSLEGDVRVGCRVKFRPAASEGEGPAIAQQAAWTAVTEFANAINSHAGTQPHLQRRHTTGVPIAGVPPPAPLTPGSHARSHSMYETPPMDAGRHSRAASASSMPDIRVPPGDAALAAARARIPPPGMSDAQLAAWLQAQYHKGESSPRVHALMRSLSMERSPQAGGSAQSVGTRVAPRRAASLPSPQRQQREPHEEEDGAASAAAGPPGTPLPLEALSAADVAGAAPVGDSTPSAPPLLPDEEPTAPPSAPPAAFGEDEAEAGTLAPTREGAPLNDGGAAEATENAGGVAPRPLTADEFFDAQELPAVPTHSPRVLLSPAGVEELCVPAQLVAALPAVQEPQAAAAEGVKGSGSSNQAGKVADEDTLCVICFTEPRSAGFVHGDSVHKCCCKSCALGLKKRGILACPICRQEIQHILFNFY
eukprot:jgi/Tetstr1/447036/TSEL_034493.t1